MSRGHKRGQSTLEYVLLVTAVIVIIIGLVVSPSSPFRRTLNTTMHSAITNGMERQANYLINSH